MEKKKKIEEEGDGAISTGSIGGSAFDASGDAGDPYVGDNAAYVPHYFGSIMKRYNSIKKSKKKRKKRKKKSRKNENFGYIEYIDNLLKE